jgi:hypothetical protein
VPDVSAQERRVERFSAAILAVATVLAAWSAFQSAKWGGEQAGHYSRAGAARTESVRQSTRAGQLVVIDVDLFTQWATAYSRNETDLAEFFFARFRDEFRPAVEAWIATRPLENPDAPRSPFVMPEYHLEANDKAEAEEQRADEEAALAERDNQRSDDYVLTAVLFASVLLFAGLAPKFEAHSIQVFMLVLAGVALLAGGAILVALPKTV